MAIENHKTFLFVYRYRGDGKNKKIGNAHDPNEEKLKTTTIIAI